MFCLFFSLVSEIFFLAFIINNYIKSAVAVSATNFHQISKFKLITLCIYYQIGDIKILLSMLRWNSAGKKSSWYNNCRILYIFLFWNLWQSSRSLILNKDIYQLSKFFLCYTTHVCLYVQRDLPQFTDQPITWLWHRHSVTQK